MNQHQFPPCLEAILVILRNVPPRKLVVDAKESFFMSVGLEKLEQLAAACHMTYHSSQFQISISYFISYTYCDLLISWILQ
jgi:hypothetical protein